MRSVRLVVWGLHVSVGFDQTLPLAQQRPKLVDCEVHALHAQHIPIQYSPLSSPSFIGVYQNYVTKYFDEHVCGPTAYLG
jgi:hypothetical protein